MSSELDVLKQYFGYASFRKGQGELVSAILSGRDVLGIMPTGAGKSVCYQVPAMLLEGLTLVVSPLISLMKDQVGALKEAGVPAAYINSSQTAAETKEVLTLAAEGEYKLLYVAPERLTVSSFLRILECSEISQVTVDEAHCISQWGQDFRPSYLRIIEFLERLPYRPVVSAFTATATARVRDDIVSSLGLDEPLVFTASFDRPNLYFAVEKPASRKNELLRLVAARPGKSGIVYCSTRKTVDEVCALLCQNGIQAARYHAGVGAKERQENQDAFLYDEKPVMVATNAFGMGIDKSNVSYVIHYNMPKDMESYYQEAGRAGRDGEPADCILLYNGQDVRTANFLIEHSHEAEEAETDPETRRELIERDRERLRLMTYYATTTDCLRKYILKYFGEKSPLSCGHCGNCDTKFEQIDATIDAQKILCCVYRLERRRLRFSKTVVSNILTGSDNDVIRKFGLNTLSTYNIMPDYTPRRVRQLVDALVEKGHLQVDAEHYNDLSVTPSGDDIVRGRERFVINLPKEKKAAVVRRVNSTVAASDVDEKLFDRLRALRKRLADRAGVPPYSVFSNATLTEMSASRPINEFELLHVRGVGQEKLRRYGDAFLEEIKAYIYENRDKNET